MCYVKTYYALARSFASLEDDTTAEQWCREGKKNGKLNTCRSSLFYICPAKSPRASIIRY